MLKRLALCLALTLSTATHAGSREPIARQPPDTSCPTISMDVGDDLWKLPLKASVVVKFDDGSESDLTYKWAVSKGAKIKEGQGTRSITVELDADEKQKDRTLVITVKVGGLNAECLDAASASISHIID